MKSLPKEVQQHIFYQAGANAIVIQDLLTLEKNPTNAIAAKNAWINSNHISLEAVGCKTENDAIQYIIKHQLTSANLSEFTSLRDNHLVELCQKCPHLLNLSVSSWYLGERSIRALEKLTELQCLDIALCSNLPEGEFTEVFKKLTKLQSLNVFGCLQLSTKFVDALKLLSDLRSLNVARCDQLPGKELDEVLSGMIGLQDLKLKGCKAYRAIKNKFPLLVKD